MKKFYKFNLKKDKSSPNNRANLTYQPQDNNLSLRRLSTSKNEVDDKKFTKRNRSKYKLMLSKTSFTQRRVFVLSAVIILGIVLFALTFIKSTPDVIVFEPAGYNYSSRSIAQYNQIVSNVIDSSLLNRFKLTVSSGQIDQTLRKDFPEINQTIENFSILSSSPKVYIQLKTPAVVDVIGGHSYVLSNQGYILTYINYANYKQYANLPMVYSNYSYNNINIGSQILTSSTIKFIQIIYYGLEEKGIGVIKVSLVPGAEEVDVYLASQPYYVKFNLHNNSPRLQLGTYLATIAKLRKQGITPKDYIDVRVPGRAYYK